MEFRGIDVRRGLELVVDEPISGRFLWTVLGREVFGLPRPTLEKAAAPQPTRSQAVQAGIAAMRRHMEPAPAARRA
ncbi:hypothetical protein BH11PSE13_BH11PSE13_36620 [soil metagenome]